MDILIKNMKMPTSCASCRFYGAYCYAKGDEDAHSTAPGPLVPVLDCGQLIDADKAIENIMIRQYALKDRTGNVDSGLFTRDIERCIKEQPTLSITDMRPVVLCEDCQYCIKEDNFEYWCNGFYSPARLVCHDDFCSHGRKKDEPMCWL